MATRAATELLYDSEASYRLVDNVIGEFGSTSRMLDDVSGLSNGDEDRALIREELFGLIAHLHFHDISAQQLSYAASLIAEMEQRLERIDAAFGSAHAQTNAA
jgi:hypothetical protein